MGKSRLTILPINSVVNLVEAICQTDYYDSDASDANEAILAKCNKLLNQIIESLFEDMQDTSLLESDYEVELTNLVEELLSKIEQCNLDPWAIYEHGQVLIKTNWGLILIYEKYN